MSARSGPVSDPSLAPNVCLTTAAAVSEELAAVPGAYRRPVDRAEGELRDRGSRFLALLVPAPDASSAAAALAATRQHHADATHCCWASRIGNPPVERTDDDGEPTGTAGPPIARVLAGNEVSDVLLMVVRWFGGTKLGKGGLARAYAGAAKLALARTRLEWSVPTETVRVVAAYDQLGAVQRLVRPPAVELLGLRWTEQVSVELRVWRHQQSALRAALADLGLTPVEEPAPVRR